MIYDRALAFGIEDSPSCGEQSNAECSAEDSSAIRRSVDITDWNNYPSTCSLRWSEYLLTWRTRRSPFARITLRGRASWRRCAGRQSVYEQLQRNSDAPRSIFQPAHQRCWLADEICKTTGAGYALKAVQTRPLGRVGRLWRMRRREAGAAGHRLCWRGSTIEVESVGFGGSRVLACKQSRAALITAVSKNSGHQCGESTRVRTYQGGRGKL